MPLELTPLEEPGTRVIVPYLSQSAQEAIRNRELHRWLQRCWWRAIQIGDLEITVIDEIQLTTETIEVPSWWANEPWKHNDGRVQVKQNIEIEGGLKIKRIVLLYDESMQEEEIDGYGPQYAGVQLLRGRQWIETLDVHDHVPREFRGGFRGFAEFDRLLERELKKTEKPQHESFDGRSSYVRGIRQEIQSAVQAFAEERGWSSEAVSQTASGGEREIATEFFTAFASGSARRRQGAGSGTTTLNNEVVPTWRCELKLDFPSKKSARVNWGQFIRNVEVSVRCEPAEAASRVDVELELAREDDPGVIPVGQLQDVEIIDGFGKGNMGDFQIVAGRAGDGKIRASEPGKYRLRAKALYHEEQVASASRHLYVQEDPPLSPQPKPHTISVSVQNLSREGKHRITNGDEIGVQVTVTNRSPEDAELRVDASLEHELLANGKTVVLDGAPLGDVPTRQAAVSKRLRVYTDSTQGALGSESRIVLPQGRHYLRADLFVQDNETPVAHASVPVYVEVDPSSNRAELPFELKSIEGEGPLPMWELREEASDQWVLLYPQKYPLYHQLKQPQRQNSKLSGRNSFIVEICANGLLEWALAPVVNGNESRIEQLKESRPDGLSSDKWENYCERLDGLAGAHHVEQQENHGEYMKRWRRVVAEMLGMFEEMD